MQEQALSVPRGKIASVEFSCVPQEMLRDLPGVGLADASQAARYAELESRRLGVVFREEGECACCHGTAGAETGQQPCPGHLGAIDLNQKKIFHPALMERLAHVMNVFCSVCCRNKYRVILGRRRITDPAQQDGLIETMREQSPQFKFIRQISDEVRELPCCDCRIWYKADVATNTIVRHMKKKGKDEDQRPEALKPKEVLPILEKLDPRELQLIGLDVINRPNCHPRNMIMERIPVAPLAIRPNIRNMGRITRDKLTDEYAKIVEAIQQKCQNFKDSENNRQKIAQLFKNFIKADKSDDATEAPKGMAERLKGKQGRMRMNVMGKRVNYCSRSVISGDPTISIDQLGVPRSVAMKLTVPEVVTDRNRPFLERLVKNGNQYPGAACVERDG